MRKPRILRYVGSDATSPMGKHDDLCHQNAALESDTGDEFENEDLMLCSPKVRNTTSTAFATPLGQGRTARRTLEVQDRICSVNLIL